MSTTYVVATDKEGSTLEVHEQSSRFSVATYIEGSVAPALDGVQELSVEQLAAMGAELIKIASYNLDAEELQAALDKHLDAQGGYRSGVRV